MGPEEAIEYTLSEEKPSTAAPLTPPQHPTHKKPPTLTSREMEVAALVGRGLSNGEVAERLSISLRTVTSHLDHIYTRLRIGSRSELTQYLRRESTQAPT